MSKLGRYVCAIVGGLMMATGTASADRAMVVLIDATGSMTQLRTDGDSRYEAAVEQARDRVLMAATVEVEGLADVAVYTFSTTGISPVTAGYVTAGTALSDIDGLLLSSPGGLTPLAASLCAVVDDLRGFDSGTTTIRRLEAFTDGEENFTDMTHACWGPGSVSTTEPFDSGPPASWQNLVYLRATTLTPAISVSTTLYVNVSSLFATGPNDPEDALLDKVGRPQAAALAATMLTDEQFFSILARDTGGTFTLVTDSEPLPVFADADGDFDVDRDDAIELALNFGSSDPTFDLDADGKVGYSDYEILLSRFGTGHNPPEADPYTQGQTVTCGNGEEVVIDGEVIEDAGITIDTRNRCDVVIRDSLIVSGDSAIRVRGTGRFTVDNSIIVGEGAWLNSRGVTTVSAANSIFIGGEEVRGAFQFEDRGGNAFQRPDSEGFEPAPSTADGYGDDDLGGGCSAGGGASGMSLLFVLFAAVFVVRRRRE